MGTMTKSTVEKADLSALAAQAAKLEQYAKNIEKEVAKLQQRIDNLDWKGIAKDSAEGRAESERTQQKRLAEGVRALKDSIVNGTTSMTPMIDNLNNSATNLGNSQFDVSEGWKVTDRLNYGAALAVAKANDDLAQQKLIEAMQARRAQEATNETIRLQRLAMELGTADDTTSSAIKSASGAIGELSPATAGMNGNQAHADLEAAADGDATPEQLARLQAATTLTPEQLDALRNGRFAELPKGQFDYLNQLMRDMDGLSPEQIENLADQTPQLETSTANALQIMGNPKVGASPEETGGMSRLPAKVQEVLRESPVKDRTLVRTEKKTGMLGQNEDEKVYTPAVEIKDYDDLKALSGLLDSGSPELRQGTDLDRGLLKQTSEIAAATTDETRPIVDARGATLSDGEIDNTLDSMLDVSSADHQAVRDFLSGENMAPTVEPGNSYDPNSHFMGLATHDWGDQDGANKVFDWIGESASDPGYEGRVSADTANSLAHLISANHATLGQDTNGPDIDGTHTLGQLNPELTQTFTKNLIPYLGGLNGVSIEGLHEIPGFSNTSELANLVKVLDSDPTSAGAINVAGTAWEQNMSNLYGQTLDPEYAEAAGRFVQAFTNGNTAEMNALRANDQWEEVQEFNGNSAKWDSIKNLVTGGLSYVPGGSEITKLYEIANPYAKLSNIDLPNNPNDMTESEWTHVIDQSNTLFQQTTDGSYRQFAIAEGYLAANKSELNSPEWQPFLTDGELDWHKVNADDDRSIVFGFLYNSLGLGGFYDGNEGYPNGLSSPNITLDDKPTPGDSNVAPR